MDNNTVRYRMPSPQQHRMFIKTGEFRPPKSGEYYLSGAIPEVYWVPNDFRQSFYIMREVKDE